MGRKAKYSAQSMVPMFAPVPTLSPPHPLRNSLASYWMVVV